MRTAAATMARAGTAARARTAAIARARAAAAARARAFLWLKYISMAHIHFYSLSTFLWLTMLCYNFHRPA